MNGLGRQGGPLCIHFLIAFTHTHTDTRLPIIPKPSVRYTIPNSNSTHLCVGDGHSVLEDDPLHSLAARWGGEGAVVGEVLGRGVWQQALEGEGVHWSTLTWERAGSKGEERTMVDGKKRK